MTIRLALASLCLGLLLATIFASGELSRFKLVRWFSSIFVALLRSLPEMLVVMFIYFGASPVLFYLTGGYVEINAFYLGVFALSLIFAAYASQTIRGALKAVPVGQAEAAKALGLSNVRIFFKIVVPQAVIHALPGLSNQWLVLLKDTALVSLIGIVDLMGQAQMFASATRSHFLWFSSVALIYLVITLLSQRVIKWLENRFRFSSGQSKNNNVKNNSVKNNLSKKLIKTTEVKK